MAYVVYDKETTRYANVGKKEYFATEQAAKAAITRAVNNGWIHDRDTVAIAEVQDFRDNIEKQVERVNIMSGKKFMEAINTPYYCSPSSETYWSM